MKTADGWVRGTHCAVPQQRKPIEVFECALCGRLGERRQDLCFPARPHPPARRPRWRLEHRLVTRHLPA